MARKRILQFNQQGFTSIEVLLSLSITLLIVVHCASIIKVVSLNKQDHLHDSQIESGVKTLSYCLYFGHDFTYGSSLTYIGNDDKSFEIKEDKGRLVMTPGYDILLHDVKDIQFYKEHYYIHLSLVYQEMSYDFIVGSDFSES